MGRWGCVAGIVGRRCGGFCVCALLGAALVDGPHSGCDVNSEPVQAGTMYYTGNHLMQPSVFLPMGLNLTLCSPPGIFNIHHLAYSS